MNMNICRQTSITPEVRDRPLMIWGRAWRKLRKKIVDASSLFFFFFFDSSSLGKICKKNQINKKIGLH